MLEMFADRTEQNKKRSKKRLQRLGNMAMGGKEGPNGNEIRGKEVEQIAQNQMNILGLQEDPRAMYHPVGKIAFWGPFRPTLVLAEARNDGHKKRIEKEWMHEGFHAPEVRIKRNSGVDFK